MSDIDALNSDVRRAFGGMEKPKSIIAEYDTGEKERAAVKDFFLGRSWQDLVGHLPNVEEVRSAVSFMLPSALRYYLPAYMLTVAQNWEHRRANVNLAADAVLAALTSPELKFPIGGTIDPPQMAKHYDVQAEAMKAALAGSKDALRRLNKKSIPMQPPDNVMADMYLRWGEFIDAFTDDQIRAISLFLMFLMKHFPESFEDDVAKILSAERRFAPNSWD